MLGPGSRPSKLANLGLHHLGDPGTDGLVDPNMGSRDGPSLAPQPQRCSRTPCAPPLSMVGTVGGGSRHPWPVSGISWLFSLLTTSNGIWAHGSRVQEEFGFKGDGKRGLISGKYLSLKALLLKGWSGCRPGAQGDLTNQDCILTRVHCSLENTAGDELCWESPVPHSVLAPLSLGVWGPGALTAPLPPVPPASLPLASWPLSVPQLCPQPLLTPCLLPSTCLCHSSG